MSIDFGARVHCEKYVGETVKRARDYYKQKLTVMFVDRKWIELNAVMMESRHDFDERYIDSDFKKFILTWREEKPSKTGYGSSYMQTNICIAVHDMDTWIAVSLI